MQIRGITVSAPDMAAGRSQQGNGAPGILRMQADTGRPGPECRVTISREGRKLSGQQAVKAGKEISGIRDVKEEKRLLRQQEQIELSREIRNGYREHLNEIEKQITDYNSSYAGFEREEVLYDSALMDKTIEEQQKLRAALGNQRLLQAEEYQRLAKEVRQLAMEAAGYRDEIDENNRNLATLLRTVEEAEKAAEEREAGETSGEGGGTDMGAGASGIKMPGIGNSAGHVLRNSAVHLMTSSVNGEWDVEEMLDGLEESGRWFVDTANSIAQNVLQRSGEIKASMKEESFTDRQIAEMMGGLQEGMALNLDNVKNFRAFGLQVLEDVQGARMLYFAGDPLKEMQKAKDGMIQSADDAVLGEAGQDRLDEASQELAEEIEELIDRRNHVDRVPEEKEDRDEHLKEAEGRGQDGNKPFGNLEVF